MSKTRGWITCLRCALALLVLPLSGAVIGSPAHTTLAIVAEDNIALRASASDSAQRHALLWAGEALEVRGRRLDHLQVYDHRRERAGFVRVSQVRVLEGAAAEPAELRAVMRFLRDLPGSEALGVAYAAAYLRAAPAEAIDAEVFDTLGTLSDRLLRRVSANRTRAHDAALAAQVDVLRSYGIEVLSYEHEQRIQLCYEGDAFRRVLAMESSPDQRARAALALTRVECVDPDLNPLARHAVDAWRGDVLDRVPRQALPAHWQNRLRLRAAQVWAGIAHNHARQGTSGREAAQRALHELAAVDRQLLAEEDASAYREAALRVGASRWAAADIAAAPVKGLGVRISAGEQPGERCVELLADAQASQSKPLLRRCSFATVWIDSARANPAGTLLALAAQPLAGWRELWVFQKGDDGWRLDVLPPAASTPDLGYIEFAGWVPGQRKLLAAREARVDGQYQRTFELIDLDRMRVEKRAEQPEHLSIFYRWQDPVWKRMTVSLRD